MDDFGILDDIEIFFC